MDTITISTDAEKLDINFINRSIAGTYWAKGRTLEETRNCIKHSLNFGMYKNSEQIGYARVVSDFTIFAYLMDVFIAETERGKGYSMSLMNEVFNHSDLLGIKNWKLATNDAHGLYAKFGFVPLDNPKKMMERVRFGI